MAIVAGANHAQTSGSEYPAPAQDKGRKLNTGVVMEWKEDSPSYLTHIQASLADLTEADKDVIHASLEEA